MKELICLLEKVSDDISNITDITKRSKEIGVTTDVAFTLKSIEDGIMNNIHNATRDQLDKLKYYKFKYYYEYNDDDVFLGEVRKRLRENKLQKILS
jgi:hypothetical protein